MVTVSAIKADIGGYPGHHSVHPDLIASAQKSLGKAKREKIIKDFRVFACGDDLQLIMTHEKGVDCKRIHKLAWDTFITGTKIAKALKLYGAGQDLLKDSFSNNLKGMGPGFAEMEIEERKSEPIVVFAADKTEAGSWNFPLYKMFADPFNTAGLFLWSTMAKGFKFLVYDLCEHRKITFESPRENYPLLSLIGSTARFAVKAVYTMSDQIGAVSSTEQLSKTAGRYVGKDDPVMIVRAQGDFPALGEVLEPFAFPFMVKGWMRGSHHGPIMPTSFEKSTPSRFDGPPRVIAAGFQLSDGKLVGPVDMFDDPSFDRARSEANRIADYMRMHGPFEPHRLPLDELEYTIIPELQRSLKERFKPI